MNDDSGGPAPGPSYLPRTSPSEYELLAEEEAALLTKYGVQGPYDGELAWTAPSQFKSQLGNGDVFLTGAAADEGDGAGEVADGPGLGEALRTKRPATIYRDPLRLYLLDNFSSLMLPDASVPCSLAEAITDTLDALEGSEGDDTHIPGTLRNKEVSSPKRQRQLMPSRFTAVLQTAKEWTQRATLAVRGVKSGAIASHMLAPYRDKGLVDAPGDDRRDVADAVALPSEDPEYHRLINTTQELLTQASAMLEDGTGEKEAARTAAISSAVVALQESEALLSHDAVDQYWDRAEVLLRDEEEEDAEQLIRKAREGRQRLGSLLKVCASSDNKFVTPSPPETDTVVCDTNEIKALLVGPPTLLRLYAFEIELPRLENQEGRSSPEARESDDDDADTNRSAASQERMKSSSPSYAVSLTRSSVAHPESPLSSSVQEVSSAVAELLVRSSTILECIAGIELQDAKAEQAAAVYQAQFLDKRRPSHAMTNGYARKEMKMIDRAALGLVVLPPFVEQLDILLSPTHEEQVVRQKMRSDEAHLESTSVSAVNDVDGTAEGEGAPRCEKPKDSYISSHSPTTKSQAGSSLERIQRRAARESFLVEREVAECRRMRLEDEQVEREERAAADLAAWHAEQIMSFQETSHATLHSVMDVERATFAELIAAAAKDLVLAKQSAELRRLQETEQLLYTLIMEAEVQREQLTREETLLFSRLQRDALDAENLARAAEQYRREQEVTAIRSRVKELRYRYEQARVSSPSQWEQTEAEELGARSSWPVRSGVAAAKLPSAAWYHQRMLPLLNEKAFIQGWVQAHQRGLENVKRLLKESQLRYVSHLHAPGSVPPASDWQVGRHATEGELIIPENPPLPASSISPVSAPESGLLVLDRENFVRILWSSLHAAVTAGKKHLNVRYLTRLTLSLEDLKGVAWTQLQNLTVCFSPRDEASSAVAIRLDDIVREIDLSGNPLQRLSVLEAARVFPQLQYLNLSQTELSSLEGESSTVSDSSPPPLHEGKRRSSPHNSSASSTHVRQVSAARNHALAAQVHLVCVDVSSNRISSLAPLGIMATASLVRCVATENRISTLDSIAGCMELRELCAAHNCLERLGGVCAFPLLRELDLGDNNVDGVTKPTNDGGVAGPPILLDKLSLSHNPLRVLPWSANMLPCLTQLFINHCQLTSLGPDSLMWVPLLTVLQAEGNAIVDISGISHCLRLRSLKLSANRLESLAALQPLMCCTRLEFLDVAGNPVFAAVEGTEASQRLRSELYLLIPSLVELNNIPRACDCADGDCQRAALETRDITAEDAGLRREGLKKTSLELSGGVVAAPTGVEGSHDGVPALLYPDVLAALCWDLQVQHIAEDKQLREADALRLLNRARGGEATSGADQPGGEKTGGHGVRSSGLAELNSLTAAQMHVRHAEQRLRIAQYGIDATILTQWATLCSTSSTPPSQELSTIHYLSTSTNVPNRNRLYAQKQREYMEQLARAYIAEWLHSRVLMRRARRELAALRLAFEQSEKYRREVAARRIQPLWRGAALRSRLHRFLHPHTRADDMEDYAKVDVEEWLTEDPAALLPVELLFQDVVDSARDVAAIPFHVPRPTVVAPSSKDHLRAHTPVPPSDTRPQKSPASHRPTPVVTQRNGESANSNVPTSLPTNGSASSIEEQWGPQVAAQIRKKQQKSTRSHQEHLRQEFMRDPLRVKKELREDHHRQAH